MKHEKENLKTKQDALDAMSGAKADMANEHLSKMEDFIYSKITEHEGTASKKPILINITIGITGLSLWQSIKLEI